MFVFLKHLNGSEMQKIALSNPDRFRSQELNSSRQVFFECHLTPKKVNFAKWSTFFGGRTLPRTPKKTSANLQSAGPLGQKPCTTCGSIAARRRRFVPAQQLWLTGVEQWQDCFSCLEGWRLLMFKLSLEPEWNAYLEASVPWLVR